MHFRNYHPTGRETETLKLLKTDPDQKMTADELAQTMGARKTVVEKSLENLEIVGCTRCINDKDSEYKFICDPPGMSS